MAAILSTAVCADEDETHAVFGHVLRRRSRDEKKILDFDASNDKEDNAEKIDFSVSVSYESDAKLHREDRSFFPCNFPSKNCSSTKLCVQLPCCG